MLIKTERLGYRMVKKIQHVEPFSSDTGTSHTDRFAISISGISVLTCDKNGAKM